MSDIAENSVPITGVGRSQSQSITGQDMNLFPFDAFVFDDINITSSPVLSIKDPWILDVGEISTSSITNFYEEVRTAAETEQILDDIDTINANLQSGYTSWFYDGTPTLLNAPAVNWTDDPTKDQHLGDVYYDGLNGKAYHFVSDVPTVYYWKEWIDSGVTAALLAADEAQDTADGKRRVFTGIVPVVPYDVGDLWTRDVSDGVWVCIVPKTDAQTYDIADWEETTDATNDDALNNFVDVTYDQFVTDTESAFEDVINGAAYLSYHLQKISKDVQNIDEEHQWSMSQITVGQGNIDIRVASVEQDTQDLTQASINLDARMDAAEIKIGTETETGTMEEDIEANTQAGITLTSAITDPSTDEYYIFSDIEITADLATETAEANATLELQVNDSETGLPQAHIDIGVNVTGIDYHNASFIALGADPNGSLINISADKITLDGTINLDDTLSVSGGIVQIIGNLSVGTTTDGGNFEVKADGTVKCTNIEAINGTFTGDITGATGEFNGNVIVTAGFSEARYTAGSIIFDVFGDISSIQPSLSGGNWGLEISSGNDETRIVEDLLVSGHSRTSGGHQLIIKLTNPTNTVVWSKIKELTGNDLTVRINATIKNNSGKYHTGIVYLSSPTAAVFSDGDYILGFASSSGIPSVAIELWV